MNSKNQSSPFHVLQQYHLLLMFCVILLQEVMAFQQPHINTHTKRRSTICKRNGVVASLVSTNIDDDAEGAATIQNQMTNMFLSSAFGMCLIILVV